MKQRKLKAENQPNDIKVFSTLKLKADGWQLLSYETEPGAGFLLRDAGQASDRLEILYWQEGATPNAALLVLDGETGNLGIGAANPTDKLTIRGALAFQPAGQDQPDHSEMGIDYDAASQSLRIRTRRGTATALSDDLLTIKQDGEITATGKLNATGGLAVTGSLSAQSIIADSLTAPTVTASTEVSVGSTKLTSESISGKELIATSGLKANSLQANGANQNLTIASAGKGALLLNPTGGCVGIGRTQPKAMLDISTPEDLTGSLLRFSPKYGDGESYHLDVRAETEPGVIRYAYDLMNNGKLFPNNLVLQSGKVGIGTIPKDASLEVNGTVKATAFAGSGAQLTAIKATSITEGVLAVERVPSLPADRIPTLDQLNGQLPVAKISGSLPLDRTTGNLSIDRVSGNLPIARTAGNLPAARVDGVFSQWTTNGAAISYTGKVSIGTTNMEATLNVGGAVRIEGNLMMNADKKIILKGTDDNHGIRYGGEVAFAGQKVDGPVIFGYGSGALGSRDRVKDKEVIALAWTQAGKVGIGATNPDGKLEIKGTAADAIIKFGGTNGDVHHLSSARDIVFNSVKGAFYFRRLGDLPYDATKIAERFADLDKKTDLMSINPTGDVAITGSISCGGKIAIKTHHGLYASARNLQEHLYIVQAAEVAAYEQFTLEMACSREFKENIAELTADEALATLQDLNPVKYDYKDEHAFRQNLGFIAEEMPANLASEDRKSISPFEVIPVLTRVVKEQQRAIAALQATIRAQQTGMQQADFAPLKS
jgi:hypothetical protein